MNAKVKELIEKEITRLAKWRDDNIEQANLAFNSYQVFLESANSQAEEVKTLKKFLEAFV